ncbi:MAG: HNH endonuclease [Verrucomicrobiae bacterium]|nr:HNH endonuclease [Verrucomicrobiae bacterium]
MRPVTRGPAPAKPFRKYGDAIHELEDRLGIYCSYCEQPLGVGLAVEHVVPKSLEPARELDWNNFLLGCANCNSVKLARPTNEADFLWPDKDNTFRPFQYEPGGFVRVAPRLARSIQPKAEALMGLVGLNRHVARDWPRPAPRDKRWKLRETAWALAERFRNRFPNPDDELCELIATAATVAGFFSVWMTVFADSAGIRTSLVRAFKGTCTQCFDSKGKARKRPGGRC